MRRLPPPQHIALRAKVLKVLFKELLVVLIKRPCVLRVVLKELGQNLNFIVKSKVLRRGKSPSYT